MSLQSINWIVYLRNLVVDDLGSAAPENDIIGSLYLAYGPNYYFILGSRSDRHQEDCSPFKWSILQLMKSLILRASYRAIPCFLPRAVRRGVWTPEGGAEVTTVDKDSAVSPSTVTCSTRRDDLVTTHGVRSLAERRQAPIVPNTVLNVLAPEEMRAVATTVRTAASPLADHMAR